MELKEHFVDFNTWCDSCKYKDTDEVEDPCDECLESPTNTNSTKPVCWKSK